MVAGFLTVRERLPRAAAAPAPACIAGPFRAEHEDGADLLEATAVLWREAETEVYGELAATVGAGPAPPADDVNQVLFDAALPDAAGLAPAAAPAEVVRVLAGHGAGAPAPATAAGWLEDLLAKQDPAPAAEAAAAAELIAAATLDIELNLAAPGGEATREEPGPPSPGVLLYPLDAPAWQGVADAAGVSPPAGETELGGAAAIGGGPAPGAARTPAAVSYPDLVAVLTPDVAPVAPAAEDLAVLEDKGLWARCSAGPGSPQGLSTGMVVAGCHPGTDAVGGGASAAGASGSGGNASPGTGVVAPECGAGTTVGRDAAAASNSAGLGGADASGSPPPNDLAAQAGSRALVRVTCLCLKC